MDTEMIESAVFLADHYRMYPGISAFDRDERGHVKPQINQKIGGVCLCTSSESEFDDVIKRELRPVSSGRLGLSFMLNAVYGEGFVCTLGSEKKAVMTIAAKNGVLNVNGKPVPLLIGKKKFAVDCTFDLDGQTASVFINDKDLGCFALASNEVSRFTMRSLAHTDTCAALETLYVYINYGICDKPFATTACTDVPRWKQQGNGVYTFERRPYDEGNGFSVLALRTLDSEAATLTRDFPESKGKVCFEYKYLLTGENASVDVTLHGGRNDAFTVSDNGTFVMHGRKKLFAHHRNVFQTLRLEADTNTGKVLVKVNGKNAGTLDADNAVSCFERVRITLKGKNGAGLLFADVLAFVIPPEPHDYVPAIIKPQKLDYYVGMNVCSLWHEGTHAGWDCITPFEENKTYLGWYDEGLAETADWEIKWMVEHGLDFGMYCWYNNMKNAPLFRTDLSDALENGHFNAKYGDELKFGIIWEAVNGVAVTSESFRNHIVPYWMDHYFCDQRYMTIDNKCVVSVFGEECLVAQFGSAEKVHEEFDYLNEQVKTLGYDGVLMWVCGDVTERRKACGFDAVHAYNWGTAGCKPEVNIRAVRDLQNKKILPFLPTVSTGFNSIGWLHKRHGQMEPEGMSRVLDTFKNEMLDADTAGGEWTRKTVMFSTWNEYGEGTFICPANLHGFGYLDAMRRAFTADTPHSDVRPNEKQLSRIGYLFPRDRGLLRAHQTEPYTPKYEIFKALSMNPKDWSMTSQITPSVRGTHLVGISTAFDPQLMYIPETPINAKDISAIRLRVKTVDPARGGLFEIFFTTDRPDGGDVWAPDKGYEFYVNQKEAGKYLILTADCPRFEGNITAVRFDPIAAEGSFDIESIELLTDTAFPQLFIDGRFWHTPVPCRIENDNAYIPYTTDLPTDVLMHAFEWHPDSKTLTLKIGHHTLHYTVGKAEMCADGKKKPLSEPLAMYDNLPMLDAKTFCEACGFTLTIKRSGIHIETRA